MRIRTYLAILIISCLSGGYGLERVLVYEFEQVTFQTAELNELKLALKDLDNNRFNLSQFFVSVDLLLGSGNTYLLYGAERQAALLEEKFSSLSKLDVLKTERKEIQLILANIRNINQLLSSLREEPEQNIDGLLGRYDEISTRTVASMQAASSHGSMRLQQQQAEIAQLKQNNLIVGYVARGLFGLIVVVAWYWFSRKICEPLWSLRLASVDARSGKQIPALNRGPREISDLSAHIRQLTNELSSQADRDPLTGLFNRRAFERHLASALVQEQQELVLCFIDLDYFKTINDSYGHATGDNVLVEIAKLLETRVRSSDIVARLGGDEFAILLTGCHAEQAKLIGEKICSSIKMLDVASQDENIELSVSIGISQLNPLEHETKESNSAATRGQMALLMNQADTACLKAKDSGRNRVVVFLPEFQSSPDNQAVSMVSVNQINQALAKDQFILFKQDITSLSQKEHGHRFEILLRMKGKDGELVSPAHFLPVAERYRISSKIDRWVINAVIDWFIRHPKQLARTTSFSVNLSAHSLGNDEFEDFLSQKIVDSGFPAEKICFEITETSAIANLHSAKKFMFRLKARGCRFALDDFGCGHSSLSYIKELPSDVIKIDGSFVKGMLDNPIDYATIKSICEIAKTSGQKLVAEFVESQAMVDALVDLDVDFGQGYFFARPEPLDNLLKQG